MSAPQSYSRWYILPAVGGNADDGREPKYARGDDRLDAGSGTLVTPDTLTDHYPALTQTYPDVARWYLIRLFGTGTAGWEALNDISVKGDTRNLATNPGDVAAVLNQRLPGADRSAEEWARSFSVGSR
jgi:hypothetical protein